MRRGGWIGWIGFVCVGCVATSGGGQEGPDLASSTGTDEDDDDDEDDDPTRPGDSDPASSSSGESDGEDPDAGEDSESSTGCSFLDCNTDTDGACGGNGAACECDVWAQDCPDGEKCAPWVNDGSNSWNATRCVPIAASPGQPGDECVAEGGGLSGYDDCAESSMCWDVDETGAGTCIGFCSGSEASPVCENPNASCVIANDGVLILCLPTCDPLMSDCGDGSACYPADDSFACVFDASGDAGAYGDPCEFTNVCDPGLYCGGAAGVPGCETANCCTSFCDLSDPNASISCPGAAGGQECVPWYPEDQAPPGFEDLGSCVIPA